MSDNSRISLRGLRTFCEAARHESFRTAGEVLFITASAVSHQIKNLEQELGQQLFDRTPRELSLTDAGRALYEDVNPLIAELNKVAASHRKTFRRSVIRISVQPFFASEYFVPRLSEFTAAHPEIDIQVGTSDETSEHHPSGSDLSVRLFRAPPAQLTSDLLFPLRLVAAGSPDFKKSMVVRKKKIASDFPLIVHESNSKAWAEWSAVSGVQLPEGTRVTRLDSMIAVIRAAERGIGAAMVPVPLTDLWFKQGSIVRLFKKELVADASYYLVCNDGKESDPGVRLLRKWILETFVIAG